ncbi:hypothetical protein VNO77_41947 [Canavalia gladiata]|uniref:Uncharacterized protein n=1 Tax=Canavalia gladiata TaxID=3824 RepID=A0AAN9PQK9_CANGL
MLTKLVTLKGLILHPMEKCTMGWPHVVAKGFSSLPKHCLEQAIIFFCTTMLDFVLVGGKEQIESKDFACLATGLIYGDPLWSIPIAIFSLVGAKPSICMKFLADVVNMKVDTFLSDAS